MGYDPRGSVRPREAFPMPHPGGHGFHESEPPRCSHGRFDDQRPHYTSRWGRARPSISFASTLRGGVPATRRWGISYRELPGGLPAIKNVEMQALWDLPGEKAIRSLLTPTRDDLQRQTAEHEPVREPPLAFWQPCRLRRVSARMDLAVQSMGPAENPGVGGSIPSLPTISPRCRARPNGDRARRPIRIRHAAVLAGGLDGPA